MVPLLKYTVLRVALFVAVLGLLAVLGAGLLVAVIGAAAVSAMLSYLFLRRPREQLTAEIAERMERRIARRGPSGTEQDEAHEDAIVDRALDAGHEGSEAQGS